VDDAGQRHTPAVPRQPAASLRPAEAEGGGVTMRILIAFAAAVTTTWTLSGMALSTLKGAGYHSRLIRGLWAELRPFYLPAVAVLITNHVMAGEMIGWNTFAHTCQIANWFFFKDVDDDDRWKRRKAKLAEKIERRGGRLVVIPARH